MNGRSIDDASTRLNDWIFDHWAWLFLTPLLVFTALPFLAPLAMSMGWTTVGKAIYTAYSPFCHQLPQRSWFLFGDKLTYTVDEIARVYPHTDPLQLRYFYGAPQMGWKVAWSDRMISLYFLTPVFGLIYFALRRFGLVNRPIAMKTLLLALTPLVLDGVTHVLSDVLSGVSAGGFRDTNEWLAFLTGDRFPGFYAGDQFGVFNWWMRLITGMLAAWGIAFSLFPWLDRIMSEASERRQPDPAASLEPGQSLTVNG